MELVNNEDVDIQPAQAENKNNNGDVCPNVSSEPKV